VIGRCFLESGAVPAAFLQNCSAIILALLIAPLLRIRWLSAFIACGGAFTLSLLWRNIGREWQAAWTVYFHNPLLKGGLWKGTLTNMEVIGVLVFWLLPLGLAYFTTLTLITKRSD